MIRSKDWTRWFKVFVLMSIFSIVQIPLTHYAFGGLDPTSFHDREQYNLRAVNSIEEINIDHLKISQIFKDAPAYSGSIEQGNKEQKNNKMQENALEKINVLENIKVPENIKVIEYSKRQQEILKNRMPVVNTRNSSRLSESNGGTDKDKDTKILNHINNSNNNNDLNVSANVSEDNTKKQAQEELNNKEDQAVPESPNNQGLESHKYVYLTIDDGPSGVSAELLDILAAKKVIATFFVLEPRVRSYPDIMSRMVKEGHEIGIHGITHNVKKFYASRESAVNEINKTKEALLEIAGKDSILVRTPYGSSPYLSREQEEAVRDEGYKIWDWNVDSRDWYYRNDEYVQSSIAQVQRLTAKGIAPVILVHELDSTARHLAKLVDYLIENDYEFRTLNINDEPVRLH